MAGHGSKPGERRGGRIAGVSKNKATKEAKLALEEMAKEYAPEALRTLARIMRSKKSTPAAQATCATALLDRGYGRPRQAVELFGDLKISNLSEAELDAAIARHEKLSGKA